MDKITTFSRVVLSVIVIAVIVGIFKVIFEYTPVVQMELIGMGLVLLLAEYLFETH